AVELLRVNRAAAALIRDGKTPQLVSVIQTGGAEGMVTLERSLDDLVRRGRIHAKVAQAANDDGHV
ncbi:MAG: twitching motility protein, partial [Myxococcales bacterium]|nr:twitching motility protein [Myxococcales bacterium]